MGNEKTYIRLHSQKDRTIKILYYYSFSPIPFIFELERVIYINICIYLY